MNLYRAAVCVLALTFLIAGVALAHLPVAAGAGAPSPMASGDSGAKHELSATDLKAKLDKNQSVIIIDARTELNGQVIKGAIHVPLGRIEEWATRADKTAWVVTYCTCPHDEAAEAEMSKLREMGFENAYSLTGGLDAARKAGLEIVVSHE